MRYTFGHEHGFHLDGAFVDRGSPCAVLFIHGNSHNLTKFGDHYRFFVENELSFFTFDYPGYGRSAGKPSEEVLYASARAAYDHLTSKLGYAADKVAVYGCSLGGAVAIELLQHKQAACLITESTFTSSREMAQHLYPYLVFRKLLPNRFRNDIRVGSLGLPVFMLHGEKDRVVPSEMGRKLYAATTTAERLFLVSGADHANCIIQGGAPLRSELAAFIRRHTY
jgi:fermentation-respiration switch protein FrsA (DUF1100 family)